MYGELPHSRDTHVLDSSSSRDHLWFCGSCRTCFIVAFPHTPYLFIYMLCSTRVFQFFTTIQPHTSCIHFFVYQYLLFVSICKKLLLMTNMCRFPFHSLLFSFPSPARSAGDFPASWLKWCNVNFILKAFSLFRGFKWTPLWLAIKIYPSGDIERLSNVYTIYNSAISYIFWLLGIMHCPIWH